MITYQGRLSHAGGLQPVTGCPDMTFRIYTWMNGSTALRTEPYSGPSRVQIRNGELGMDLGSLVTFASAGLLFDQPYYLGMQILPDSEMSPRKPSTSGGYALHALKAQKADHASKSDHAQKSDHATNSDNAGHAKNADQAQNADTLDSTAFARLASANTFSTGTQTIQTVAGTKGLVVKGAAGQTAALLGWQDSAGAVRGSISVVGQITGSGTALSDLKANLPSSGTLSEARLAGTYSGALTLSSAANRYAGSGAGPTGLSASNLATGTLPSARLSGTYSSAVTLSDPADSFSGDGSLLTGVVALVFVDGGGWIGHITRAAGFGRATSARLGGCMNARNATANRWNRPRARGTGAFGAVLVGRTQGVR